MSRFLRLAIFGLFALVFSLPASGQFVDLDEARQMLNDGDFESAQVMLEMAVDDDPDNADAQYLLGSAYGIEAQNAGRVRQMRLAGKIKKAFERAVEIDPQHFGAREGLIQFHLQAPRIAGGKKEVAQEHAEAMMEIDPQRGWVYLGMVLEERDDDAGAARVYREGAASAPATFAARSRAVYFFQQQQQYDDALAILRPLAAAGDWSAHYQIGRTASFAGAYLDEGAASLEAYIADYTPDDQHPSHAHASNRLGQIYVHQGRTQDARAAFEAALALDPEIESAREALKKLR